MTTTNELTLQSTSAYTVEVSDRYAYESDSRIEYTWYNLRAAGEQYSKSYGVSIDWGDDKETPQIGWYATRTEDIEEAKALAEILQLATARIAEGK